MDREEIIEMVVIGAFMGLLALLLPVAVIHLAVWLIV